ncbi:MAG: hypothetical protein PHD68_02235 [Rugosibacter sp.]|nr:hypothetical protein [Rugosibacter sp.]
MNKPTVLKPGMIVVVYGPDGLTDLKAELLARLPDELEELCYSDDIAKEIEETTFEKWEVRFLGETWKTSTFARWINPTNIVEENTSDNSD